MVVDKRFQIKDSNSHHVGYDIIDTQISKRYYGGRLSQAEELCELLNAQHEEIQSLKQKISDCKSYNATLYANHTKSDRMLVNDIKELKEIGDYQAKRIEELNEENRKLEEQLRNLRRLANEMYMEGSE